MEKEESGKDVCLLRAKASRAPVYVKEKDGAQTSFYVRTGNATQPLGMKEAMEYIVAHWKRAP